MVRGAWAAATGAILLTLVPGSAAQAVTQTPACSTANPAFCFSFGATVTTPGGAVAETRAAAPFDLSVGMTNTSATHTSDKTRWFATVAVDLLSSATTSPLLTPSSEMPDGLMIAGTAAGCPAGVDYSFSACTAGFGAALADVSGTGGLFDGVRTATFGIQRIVNVHTTPSFVDYDVQYTACVSTPFGACVSPYNGDLHLLVSPPSGGQTLRTLTLVVAGSASFGYPGGTANVDYSLDSLTVNLQGTSNQLGNGSPADHAYNVLRLPPRCGAVSSSGAATDRAGATGSVPQSVTITGCPTVSAVSGVVSGMRVAALSAAAGSPLGRTITAYEWAFGDGTTATTTGPSVQHTYASTADRGVVVTAIDQLGARSAPATTTLSSSAITVSGPAKVTKGKKFKLKGTLTSHGAGLAGRSVTVQRCTAKGQKCKPVATATTKASGKYAVKVSAKKKSLFVVTYAGGPAVFGCSAAHAVKIKH
ncbi:MAG: hypothetical protein QOD98_2472 [Nocardioidaceae bacterium]|nr:hypothetical protein [Nocardioidaceae bacterium]